MNGSLAMRSTRLRTLLLVLVGGGMVLSLYLFTSSQYHLKYARHLLEACQQQKDSLLAQLQVVYEQKNRVEKSLQQEKVEHRKTLEESQKNTVFRKQLKKEKDEVDTKLAVLQKEQQVLQDKHRELEAQTKDLLEEQVQNEKKKSQLQSDFEQSLRFKDEENNLLRGNLTLVIKERENLEQQLLQLNINHQQLKTDLLNFKKMYLDINARLKKLSKQNISPKVAQETLPKTEGKMTQVAETLRKPDLERAPTPDAEQQQHAAGALPENHENAQGSHEDEAANGPQHNTEQRHPLPAPKTAPKSDAAELKDSVMGGQAAPMEESPQPHGEMGAAERPAPNPQQQPESGLREQLQPPDFNSDHVQHQDGSSTTSTTTSPVQAAGNNQPILPLPPQPQDNNQPQDKAGEDLPADNVAQSSKQNQAVQSQEQQKDQDTMARKPIVEQQYPVLGGGGGEGGGMAGQDLRVHEGMFMGPVPQWNPLGKLAVEQQLAVQRQHPQQDKAMSNKGMRQQEEEENYPEDGDDDNAEEQDENLRDKNIKPFQDHDFEDNDGNDHNQAKEEGIVIAPK